MSDPRRCTALTVLAAAVALTLTACTTSKEGGTVDIDPAVADLSAADEAALLFMREEELLALDVYKVLAGTRGLPILSNIAEAGATRPDAVRVLLKRYDLDNPVPSRDAGEYADLRAGPADAPDVAQVFHNIERGSRNHLRAFVRLDQRGFDHTATHLTQAEVDEILDGDIEHVGA